MQNQRPVIVASLIWLGLNLARYNLFGYLNTWPNFLRFDIMSWLLVCAIIWHLTNNRAVKSIVLFTFVIIMNAINNAFIFGPTNTNYSELVFLFIALLIVALYNYVTIKKMAVTGWKTIMYTLITIVERFRHRIRKLRGG